MVIPVLDERQTVVQALACTGLPGVERIVVDGGSTDGTPELGRASGAERVLRCEPGRARQMDAGYRAASGDVILFLHADTLLSPGWLEALRRALADPGVAGGAFRLAFASRRPVYRAIELWVLARSRLGLPFGDQALFVRRELLAERGGVPQVPIFEDLDLVSAIRAGGRLALLGERAWTSTRRYERNGLFRQGLRNHAALVAWLLGLPRERVALWYRHRPAR